MENYRKSKDTRETSASLENPSSSRGIGLPGMINNIEVSVTIIASFENADDLKQTIRQTLDFPSGGKFEVNFISHSLKRATRISTCKFEITTSKNISIIDRCLDEMVIKLKDRLKTIVEFEKHPNKIVKVKEQCQGQGQCSIPTESSHSTLQKINTNNSSKFVHENHNGPQLTMQIKNQDIRLDKACNIKYVSPKEEIKTMVFESTKIASSNNGSGHRFGEDSMIELHHRVDLPHQKSKFDERDTTSWQSRIEKILIQMENKKDTVLSKHDDKMLSYRKQIEVLEKNKRKYSVEINAIEDKLTEASRQKLEFFCKCNKMALKIQEMCPSDTAQRELLRTQEEFGIECQRLTSALPIYARREDIVSHVNSNQVSIILGETGSGKSTQIAQYLYEAGHARDGLIVCTQPRKVAAVQLADRVAQEMAVRTGGLVGYKTGNKGKIDADKTKIVFMTDHALLNECLEDGDFRKYACVIVDEAHERSIYTDILLGMIKACLPRRPDLKVIITSATIDPQVFINYFHCPKEIQVSGRTFPVDVFYTLSSDDFDNYENKAVWKAAEIHRNQPEGDILVFLTSAAEIQRCCDEFCKIFQGKNDFKCLPLHGQLLPEEQKEAFSQLDAGVRKVVFATNCAETSVTIDGIRYVIDTGVSKEMRYDPKKNLNLLGVHMISQSSANQRKGRAGRTASGKCFRLYSEEEYQRMRKINEPEILRVHLGQAILKLAELGVAIREYDYVESPSADSLQAALDTLVFLGAIENEKITDTGRWISKLPFDPKLGYVVFKSKEYDLLYDAVVLASVVSNGSGLFYRGITETEAQISARIKVEFGWESGDIFTWLTVYKTWEAIPSVQERRRWCKFNFINNKSMTYTKNCIDDVIQTLFHDMQLNIDRQYSDVPCSITILSKLMLRAYGRSLCHFMGHSRAGYFSVFSQRQVHLHPSSTLASQNLQPKWLLYVDLVKTSREFIKGVLVMQEEWIQEAVEEGRLDEDTISKAECRMLDVVHKEELGMSAFRSIVGPRYSHIRDMEEMCEAYGMKHTVVEADREQGTVTIYSTSPEIHRGVFREMKKITSDVIRQLEEEEAECKIYSKDSNDSPNVRAVLGTGGCVRRVLMPHQTAEVLLWKVGEKTEEDILLKFSEFGNVLQVISFKSIEPWGFVRYRRVEEAATACQRTKQDNCMAGSPKLDRGAMSVTSNLQAKVAWVRRPIKGDGTAFINCNPIYRSDLVGKRVMINGSDKVIKPAKKRNGPYGGLMNELSDDLVIFKVGKKTTEEELKGLLTHGVLGGERIDMELKVRIARDRVEVPTQRELDAMRDSLRTFIDPDNAERFNVCLLPPRPNSLYQIGFLNFNDPIRGLRICQRQNRRIEMSSEPVKITPTLRTTIIVPKKVKAACEEKMEKLFTNLKTDLDVSLEWKKLKEDYAITLQCENPEGIVKARECIAAELKGEIIDCNHDKSFQCLLTSAGQDYLNQLQKCTDCVIISDRRTKIIHLYGKSPVKTVIEQYVAENEGKRVAIYRLKNSGKPPGLMKALMNKFGPLLDRMSEEYNELSSVSLDCRTHILKCRGTDASIEELDKYLSRLEKELFEAYSQVRSHIGTNSKSVPECSVCMDDVDNNDSLYRMEACGHPYCLPCLQHQILACVQSNNFPLACAKENCGKEFVWKDLRYVFNQKWIAEEKLIHSSLNFLVSSNPDKFKFCPTANCPVVYEATVHEDGCEFNCPACFASTCSSCHVAFHAGVSCKMAKSGTGAEGYLKKWVSEDPNKRKICPGCNIPIEKTAGCNKMHCTGCHTIFCWICREKFKDEGKCYDHLTKYHNGIFDENAL